MARLKAASISHRRDTEGLLAAFSHPSRAQIN
jgi:hypothetical protein